ncbi:putative mitogen-activated protein kinase kinase kinase STE-STE11 family [Helianthus anomalus]
MNSLHFISALDSQLCFIDPSRLGIAAELGDIGSLSPHQPFRNYCFKNWQKVDMLGRGSLGPVYEGVNEFGLFFSVKEVDLPDQGGQGTLSVIELEQMIYISSSFLRVYVSRFNIYPIPSEISLLSVFQHENIVRYLGTDKVCISSLEFFLKHIYRGFEASMLMASKEMKLKLFILIGLNYLHHRHVVHRDIKCANILVDASRSVKLADYGLAKVRKTQYNIISLLFSFMTYDYIYIHITCTLQPTTLNNNLSFKGTPHWMAPEVNFYYLKCSFVDLGCVLSQTCQRGNR